MKKSIKNLSKFALPKEQISTIIGGQSSSNWYISDCQNLGNAGITPLLNAAAEAQLAHIEKVRM